jgi:hypothetical protein
VATHGELNCVLIYTANKIPPPPYSLSNVSPFAYSSSSPPPPPFITFSSCIYFSFIFIVLVFFPVPCCSDNEVDHSEIQQSSSLNRGSRVRFPAAAGNFLLHNRPPSLLSNGYQGLFPWGVKRPGREADHSPPSSTEVNVWRYTPTSPIHIHGVVLS